MLSKAISGRTKRFSDKFSELADQLYPIIRSSTERPTLKVLIENAESFVANWVLPNTDEECEYLERLTNGEYRLELIFQGEPIINAAAVNPEALWKLKNLKKMPR